MNTIIHPDSSLLALLYLFVSIKVSGGLVRKRVNGFLVNTIVLPIPVLLITVQ